MKFLCKIPEVCKKILRFAKTSRPGLVITVEMLAGLVLCFISLFIFLHFTIEMLETDFNRLDSSFSESVYALRTPDLTQKMLTVSKLGSGMNLTIVMLVIILILMRKHRKEAYIFCLTLLMGIVLNICLKQVIQRPRPQFSPLIVEHMSSFPSGHAMNSFIFFALISYFSYHFFHDRKFAVITGIFSAGCVLLIGFSRIYLGVHYFTDVVAGYIAGFWWFVTVLLIDRTFIFYRIFKKSES